MRNKSEAQAYLEQVKKLDLRIKNKLIEKQQWKDIALGITTNTESERVQSSGSLSKMADAIAKCVDMEAEIDKLIDELVVIKTYVIQTIEQLDSPIVYCCGRQGTASLTPDKQEENLNPLFDTILETIPPMEMDVEGAGQLLVSCIDYNEFVGRIGIGRI